MKIAIGCDHGGYLLKQDILIWLEEHDYDFEDFGCFNTDSVDYPVYGEKVAHGSWMAPVAEEIMEYYFDLVFASDVYTYENQVG